MIDLSQPMHEHCDRRRDLLLVEDDTAVVASLRMFLEPDYKVHAASTVRGGVELFKSLKPSLVVLDLRLGEGDGLDALREIRTESATAPVIVLTGYASMNSVEESLRLGASDFLHKPFDGFALRSRIDELTVASDRSNAEVIQELAKSVPEIADLKLRANASAMFLHDASGPVMVALSTAHLLCAAMERNPERFDDETREIGALLYRSMGFVSGLFEQSRSLDCLGRLEASDVAIGKIVNLATEMVRTKAAEHSVSVTVQLKGATAIVRANQFALARVLLNLLRNAIEAVEPRTGRVALLVDSADQCVEFSVEDNGLGIAPELMEKVFEARFTTKPQGMGLGLFTCKQLVEKMGGTLTVRNEPGAGCRFTVKIPHAL